jgi:hypothetical protein
MKTLSRLSALASGLFAFSSSALLAQTPYLETSSVSILWNFTITGVSGTTIGPKPIVLGAPGAIDPDALRPGDRVTTDIGTPITYTVDTGNQAFFVKQLVRAVLERYATQSKGLVEQFLDAAAPVLTSIEDTESAIAAIANQLAIVTDPAVRADLLANRATLEATLLQLEADLAEIESDYLPDIALLEDRIKYLKREADGRWELTAVREAQQSVAGVANTPYAIFLSRIERVRGYVSPTFDTGMRIEPIYSAGDSVETLVDGRVTRATGKYTTHFRLEFGALYASDPLNGIDFLDRATKEPGADYATAGDRWDAEATGYMTYNIRSTLGPLAAVLPTKIKVTGHGSWSHGIVKPDEPTLVFNGIAPLSIKMGEVKFQNRAMFPEFAPAP